MGRDVAGGVDVFNATSQANFNMPDGHRRSPNFLILRTTTGVTRTAQLNVWYGF